MTELRGAALPDAHMRDLKAGRCGAPSERSRRPRIVTTGSRLLAGPGYGMAPFTRTWIEAEPTSRLTTKPLPSGATS